MKPFSLIRPRASGWLGTAMATLLLGAGVAQVPSQAQVSAQPPAQPASNLTAGIVLARIRNAAANRSYQGTMVFSTSGVVNSSRVAHFCDGRQRYERIEVMDGQMRQQLRHNDQVLTLWPQTKVAVMEQQDPVADFPSLPAASLPGLDNYELRSLGNDRIAGHEAEVLMLKPRDNIRYAQRLWSERETGLLLRTDVLGPRGEVLESTAFTELAIGGRPQPELVMGPMKRLEGYRVVRAAAVPAQLDAEGWTMNRSVPGFQLVSCVKRSLDAATDGASEPRVLQSVFSDGLTHVSVFIEPYDAKRHRPMRTMLGATNTVMNRHDDWWITVVGDVPMATVQQFETLFERRR